MSITRMSVAQLLADLAHQPSPHDVQLRGRSVRSRAFQPLAVGKKSPLENRPGELLSTPSGLVKALFHEVAQNPKGLVLQQHCVCPRGLLSKVAPQGPVPPHATPATPQRSDPSNGPLQLGTGHNISPHWDRFSAHAYIVAPRKDGA